MAKTKLGNVKGPKGDTGKRGSEWRVSDKMTGQSTSGTAFPGAGFEDSVVNDMCLNPTTFDLYRCKTAGDAATAKWVWECNIKGPQGDKGDKGDPTTVDAALSESSANPIQNKAVATKFKDVQDSLALKMPLSVITVEGEFTSIESAKAVVGYMKSNRVNMLAGAVSVMGLHPFIAHTYPDLVDYSVVLFFDCWSNIHMVTNYEGRWETRNL